MDEKWDQWERGCNELLSLQKILVARKVGKAMKTYDYQSSLEAAIQIINTLTPEEQIRLLDDLKVMIHNNKKDEPLHGVMEFDGFAKDLWKDVDVEEYIRQERASWGNGPSYHNDDTHSESDKL
jgi:hypothetical protein